jgi:hypothetical protein
VSDVFVTAGSISGPPGHALRNRGADVTTLLAERKTSQPADIKRVGLLF